MCPAVQRSSTGFSSFRSARFLTGWRDAFSNGPPPCQRSPLHPSLEPVDPVAMPWRALCGGGPGTGQEAFHIPGDYRL